MPELETIQELTQWGFNPTLIFVLLGCCMVILAGGLYMGKYVIDAFAVMSSNTKDDIKQITVLHRDDIKEMNKSHKEDMKEMSKDHKAERQECHASMETLIAEIRRISK